jgi:hypothetical protein
LTITHITAAERERTDVAYPPLVITSIDLDRMLAVIQSDRLSELAEYLPLEVNRLHNAGYELRSSHLTRRTLFLMNFSGARRFR